MISIYQYLLHFFWPHRSSPMWLIEGTTHWKSKLLVYKANNSRGDSDSSGGSGSRVVETAQWLWQKQLQQWNASAKSWIVFQDWQNWKVSILLVWVKSRFHPETSSELILGLNGKWGSPSAGWQSLVLVCGMQRQWSSLVCLSLHKRILWGIGLGLFLMQRWQQGNSHP